MDKNLIKNVVTGIEFTEESKQRIFDGIERKKTLKEKMYMKRITTGIVVIGMVCVCFLMNVMLKDKAIITVYAMTQGENEKCSVLIPEHEETLRLIETPVGNGYIFQIDIPENYMYECKSVEKENSLFTIYQNEKNIYWITKSNKRGKIYNSEKEKLENNTPHYVNECEFEIVVYNENKEISYEEVIKFELVNGECVVTLER